MLGFGAATPINPNGYRPTATKTDFRDVQHNPKLIDHIRDLNHINRNISTVHADHVAIQTFVHEIKYIIEDAEDGIDQSCNAIIALSEECQRVESTCQYVAEGIVTNEKTIRKYVQIMNVFQRVCTIEDVPSSEIILARCNRGEHWKNFNPRFEKYGFLNEAQPKFNLDFNHELGKRAIFTLAVVAISTVIGGLAVAGVTMATENIAKSEANRVMAIEAGFREAQNEQHIINFIRQNNATLELAKQVDTHEYIATVMARSTNNLFQANERMTEIKHMLSLDKEWALEDPNTEMYQTAIRSFANEGIRGLTKAEYGEIYRLMSGMSVTKTSVFSEDPSVRTCRSTTVSKTLVVPVIDSLSITEYETKDGRLVKVNSKPGFYNIIPSEAILSKKTTIFGENIQVTGRSCEVREDIITEVEPTGDFLSDKLLFKFNGTIKLTEVCRTSNGVVTSKWSFENEIYIELPISCSITSKQIKCGALKITSNKVVTVETGPTRMRKITKKKTGETAAKISGKVFRGNVTFPSHFSGLPKTTLGISTFYWILIGAVSGGILVIVIVSVICVKRRWNTAIETDSSQDYDGGSNNLPVKGATFVKNEININSNTKRRLGSFKRKKSNTDMLEEILDSPAMYKELDNVPTMGELAALEIQELS